MARRAGVIPERNEAQRGAQLKNQNLVEIARTIREAKGTASIGADMSRLIIRTWRLLAEGRPISQTQVEQIASDQNLPRETAMSVIKQISEPDRDGNIVGLLGLTLNPMTHRFQINGRTLFTWCAADALFLPGMLKRTAKVESTCPVTKEKIQLTITPEGVEQYDPASTVISIIVPTPMKKGLESVEEIWAAFCNYIHFFSSSEAASEWFTGRNHDPLILSIEDGHQLWRMVFDDMLKYV